MDDETEGDSEVEFYSYTWDNPDFVLTVGADEDGVPGIEMMLYISSDEEAAKIALDLLEGRWALRKVAKSIEDFAKGRP